MEQPWLVIKLGEATFTVAAQPQFGHMESPQYGYDYGQSKYVAEPEKRAAFIEFSTRVLRDLLENSLPGAIETPRIQR